MSLTASIVIHDSPRSQTERIIDCLLKSEIEKIYVIDNSTIPVEYADSLKAKSVKIDYRHVENNGFGAAHNIAIREAIDKNKGIDDFHLIVNPDVYWEEDVLESLTKYLAENKDVGIVMPKVFYPDGALQYTCRMLPTPLDLFTKRFLPAKFSEKRMERYLLADHDHNMPLNCPYLLGSFLLFRNKALKECGLFDERFFMYPEDIDITRRIHRRWKTMYLPSLSIIHKHTAASRTNRKMLKIHIVNMIKYFCKWGWVCDRERKLFNLQLRENITYIPKDKRPIGRG